jgi:hypothetical protein
MPLSTSEMSEGPTSAPSSGRENHQPLPPRILFFWGHTRF